jgi:hypothetical protein
MMGKNIMVIAILCALVAPVTAVGPPYAIDGNLNDWGVTPFVDWVPDSPTADYRVEDYDGTNPEPGPNTHLYPGGFPYGGESYDIEAMYFDDAPGKAYFGVVLSIPEGGYTNGVTSGDLALDIDKNPNTGMYGFEYGVVMNGPHKGYVYYLPDWSNPHCTPAWGWCTETQPFIMQPGTGTYVGRGNFLYVNANHNDNGRPNYVIEGVINKAYIGLPEKGTDSAIHSALTCGNDEIDLNVGWDYNAPEFASMAVVGLIVVSAPALAYLLVRKKE